ncbi:MAG TPA: helix-turn-helix domain-containing protein [Streptosporangiaceae bacterium]|nr:helix-turn-helix domain-containing protein [Streptosporangiaceae bacterium]
MIEAGIEALDLLRAADAAKIMRCSEQTVRRKCYSGELGHLKIGSLLRIRKSDLAAYYETLGEPAPEMP